MLPNLIDVRENPPSLNVSAASDINESIKTQTDHDEAARGNADVAADNIDWDISVDSSAIDWDIGTIEETEDGANGLGPYEIVNASDVLQNSSPNEPTQANPSKGEESLQQDISVSEISWDVSVETPQVAVIDDVSLSNIGLDKPTSAAHPLTETSESKEVRSQLLEIEYRNNILDDLNEVCQLYPSLCCCKLYLISLSSSTCFFAPYWEHDLSI